MRSAGFALTLEVRPFLRPWPGPVRTSSTVLRYSPQFSSCRRSALNSSGVTPNG